MDLIVTTVDIEKALVVPYEAVVEKDGKRVVYVVENDTAREKKVETGLDIGLYTEIRSGLKEGDRVVVSPDELLMDGAKVSVINNQPAAGGTK